MEMKLAPIECSKDADVIRLNRDNFNAGSAWILTDGVQVTIAEQEWGGPPKQEITLDRSTFNKLIRWYIREQSVRA